MADENRPSTVDCETAQAVLARGGADSDWDQIDRHLAECADCAAGLRRVTAAIDEQFAASRVQAGLEEFERSTAEIAPAGATSLPARQSGDGRLISLPDRRAAMAGTAARTGRRRFDRGLLATLGAAAAAVVLLIAAIVAGMSSSGGTRQVSADRRPEFVPSLDVLPSRPDHTYFAGEQIQVCLRINQPSRIHLSVLEGHTTFDLYDANSDPGQHCFPEQVKAIIGRATLRVEVFYGAERVAREDFVLLPASPR
jgi:hypothetical protein